MVQEKDAAARRVAERKAFLERQKADLDAHTIRFRWCVVEHTPAYNTGGYYDQDIKAKNVVVSEYFDTEEQAIAWRDRHEPDEGNTLFVKRERLVQRSYQEWVGF